MPVFCIKRLFIFSFILQLAVLLNTYLLNTYLITNNNRKKYFKNLIPYLNFRDSISKLKLK